MQRSTSEVAYAYLCSKIMTLRGIAMVLAKSIERDIVYLILSKNTIKSCVVLDHGIDKG